MSNVNIEELYEEIYADVSSEENFSADESDPFFNLFWEMLSPNNSLTLEGKIEGLYAMLKDYGGYSEYCDQLYQYIADVVIENLKKVND